MNEKKLRVVNFFAGPGCGKSTTSAGLFFELKHLNANVELIPEFAKDATWEKRSTKFFETQEHIFGEQSRRTKMAAMEVDFVITDSPLLLAAAYIPENYPLPSLKQTIVEAHNEYESLNILLIRSKPFNPVGRNQTEVEAKEKDSMIRTILDSFKIEYTTLAYDYDTPKQIVKQLKEMQWIK